MSMQDAIRNVFANSSEKELQASLDYLRKMKNILYKNAKNRYSMDLFDQMKTDFSLSKKS